jgi:hypothetical protein
MGGKLWLIGIFLGMAPAAWAQDRGAAVADAASALDHTLRAADEAVARAAEDLGRTGLRGERAHARLEELCAEVTYAITCDALDRRGVIVSSAPAAYSAIAGSDVEHQAHVRELLGTREPVLSGVFPAVEGVELLSLAHPVYGPGGRFLGSVAIAARPDSLVGYAVKPVVADGSSVVVVEQEDGTVLFGPDTPRIDRGAGWRTVDLHGTEWRVAVAEAPIGRQQTARYDEPDVPIPAEVGLRSLITIADGHLTAVASDLTLLAASPEARSGQWSRVEEPLRRVAGENVPGVYFFAEPDGSYWSLDRGPGASTLSDREYFGRVLAGETVVGELVVGKTLGRTEGVVAVPVRGADGDVVGVIGASVFLDELTARIRDEMGLGEDLLFYAFDDEQRVVLHPDAERVFLRAGELGPEVEDVFDRMEARGEGVIRYTYEGTPRTLVFDRSRVTGWTYAFGFVGERRPET